MVSTAIHTKENLQGKDVTITDAKNARRAKVSAWIYYRQLFAKKEILQYKEMIEISRWRLDRSHPYGLWFIYWDPPKIQTSYIRRKGGNTRLSKEILFLIHGVLETALQEGILVKPRTLSRTSKGEKPSTRFSICRFRWFSVPESCSSEYSEICSEKKLMSIGCSDY